MPVMLGVASVRTLWNAAALTGTLLLQGHTPIQSVAIAQTASVSAILAGHARLAHFKSKMEARLGQ